MSCQDCFFWHPTVSRLDFVRSYLVPPVILLIYRLLAALWFTFVWGRLFFEIGPVYFVHFTNCTLTLFIAYFWLAVYQSVRYLLSASDADFAGRDESLGPASKASWILLSLAFPNSVFLDIVYWSLLHESDMMGFYTVNAHLINSFVLLGELLLDRIIIVPSHLVAVLIFGLLYLGWELLYYYVVGGWIYPFLDTTKGLFSLGYYFLMIGSSIVSFFGLEALILLREYVAERLGARHPPIHSRSAVPQDSISDDINVLTLSEVDVATQLSDEDL